MSKEGNPRVTQQEINSLEAKPMPIHLAFGETPKKARRRKKRVPLEERTQRTFGKPPEDIIPHLVNQAGSPSAAARALGADHSSVWNWIRNPRALSVIERQTQMVHNGKSAKEIIPDLYTNQDLSDDQIAELLGFDEGGRFAISAWRADNGVLTHPRKETVHRSWGKRRTQVGKEGKKLVLKARRDNPTVFSKLTATQRKILTYCYPEQRGAKPLTHDEVAAIEGVKRQAVDAVVKRALSKIQELLTPETPEEPILSNDRPEASKKPSEGNTKRFYSQSSEVRVDKAEGAKDKKVGFKRKTIRVNEEDARTVLEARRNPDIFFRLTLKQREVLRYRYPVRKNSKPLSLEETARKIGVGDRRVVWEREQGFLRKIRKLLRSKKQKAPVDK